ncbi:putative SynN domain-containing protein [Pseudomonas chlororaphis]
MARPPSPLEICKQPTRLLENEIQKLSLQLQKVRDEERQVRGASPTEGVQKRRPCARRSAISTRSNRRETDDLRQMLTDLKTLPKTIV